MTFRYDLRVYYEDTDAGGIVYYANYLKFAERARSEFLRANGLSNKDLIENEGVGIVVRQAVVDYHAPARLDDYLSVHTVMDECKKAGFTMRQTIVRDGLTLVTIVVKLACIKMQTGRPVPIPKRLQEILNA